MTDLDRENLTVALNQWRHHKDNHTLMYDPGCVYCEDDPRWKPGHKFDPVHNVAYAPKGD